MLQKRKVKDQSRPHNLEYFRKWTSGSRRLYPSLSRETGAKILDIIAGPAGSNFELGSEQVAERKPALVSLQSAGVIFNRRVYACPVTLWETVAPDSPPSE
jgi:hypothetical protein